jgi:hypothetical protein
MSLAHFKDVVQPEIQTVAIGRRRLYDRKDLDRWANMHEVGGSTSTPISASTACDSAMTSAALAIEQ